MVLISNDPLFGIALIYTLGGAMDDTCSNKIVCRTTSGVLDVSEVVSVLLSL